MVCVCLGVLLMWQWQSDDEVSDLFILSDSVTVWSETDLGVSSEAGCWKIKGQSYVCLRRALLCHAVMCCAAYYTETLKFQNKFKVRGSTIDALAVQ